MLTLVLSIITPTLSAATLKESSKSPGDSTYAIVMACAPNGVTVNDVADGDFAAHVAFAQTHYDGLSVMDMPTKSDLLAELSEIGARGEVYNTITFVAIGVGLGADNLAPAIACRDFNVDDESTWVLDTEIAQALKGKAQRYVSFLDLTHDHSAALGLGATYGPNADTWVLGANNYVLAAAAPQRYANDGFISTLTSTLSKNGELTVEAFEAKMTVAGINIHRSLTMDGKGIGEFSDPSAVISRKPIVTQATANDIAVRKPLTVTPRGIAWATGGACLAGAAITGGLAYSTYTEIAVSEWPAEHQDEWFAKNETYLTLRGATIGLGACGAAGGIVGAILGPSEGEIATVSVVPLPNGAVAELRW